MAWFDGVCVIWKTISAFESATAIKRTCLTHCQKRSRESRTSNLVIWSSYRPSTTALLVFDSLHLCLFSPSDFCSIYQVKKQPHNMTHVEILLGEGERTIGARWNNGVVQEFDSYNFVSKSYHSMQFYFKSIDPWLLGYCRR